MDITICEFCKIYVANFEVHSCFNLGINFIGVTQPFLKTALLIWHKNSGSRATQPMDYEDGGLLWINLILQCNKVFFTAYINEQIMKRRQMLKRFTQYGGTNPNTYNPQTSDFMFPGMHPVQENESDSKHLQLPSVVGEMFMHQNSQNYEPLNPENPSNISVSVIGA
ncbi:hypothetical protein CEXT_267751 [Caerostris extrusa]|uniref:Uncharacterized protein n=1 Tax=Caerostris extrusa TaxID=172846 RepID=A0AAV4YAU3_CAEEX|nr:hypothetical protein CEXT_267751 [Caerostris extrusa]